MTAAARSEEIYEALFDDGVFAALPDLIARTGRGRDAHIIWRHDDAAHEVLVYNYHPADYVRDYMTRFAAIDPWNHLAGIPINRFVHAADYVPDDVYEQSAFYNEFIRPAGDDTFRLLGGVFVTPAGTGIIGVQRGRSQPDFEQEDAVRLQSCAADLTRVLKIRGELASLRRGAAISRDAWDVIGLASLVVRSDGRIVQRNAAAETTLRRADGLTTRGGMLSARVPRQDARLAAAITRATAPREPAGSATLVDGGAGAPPYLVTVMPLRGHAGAAMALVLFKDPLAPDASIAARLRALHGLTRSEARVAADLSTGLCVDGIAQTRGVSVNTVKSQLKAVAAKLGCSRQSEIIARIRDLAPIADQGDQSRFSPRTTRTTRATSRS